MASLIGGKIMNKRSQQEKEVSARPANAVVFAPGYLAVALHQAPSWTNSSSR